VFESEKAQQLFIDIWVKIAQHYKDEPVILGYDLLNEPIAPYFENVDELNAKLEPLYKRAVSAIREVDKNHVILLGGSQWNSNFDVFSEEPFDDNMMYTCHRYGGEPTADAIKDFIAFRDKVNRPMYMGETGHNTNEWMSSFVKTLEENNIGWHFWPYKKLGGSSFVSISTPDNWKWWSILWKQIELPTKQSVKPVPIKKLQEKRCSISSKIVNLKTIVLIRIMWKPWA